VCGSPPGTPPLIPTIAGARALAELSHTSARLRLPLSAPSAESCWRFKHWTPRRASRSGVVAPDAAMPWCVRVCQRAARPSLKHATSNRVFVIRAEKGGVLSAFCDYACTAPHASAHRKRYSTCLRVNHALRAAGPPDWHALSHWQAVRPPPSGAPTAGASIQRCPSNSQCPRRRRPTRPRRKSGRPRCS
jgi:hypothetical protein